MEGNPTPLSSSVGFFRTSYVENLLYQYKSVFFDKYILKNHSNIDEITDTDKALCLVEEYANTGFIVLSNRKNEYDEEYFMKIMLNVLNRTYKDIMGDGIIVES